MTDDQINNALDYHSRRELAIGWLRYEAIRKLNPRQFTELHERNLKGERFDDLVDELVDNS